MTSESSHDLAWAFAQWFRRGLSGCAFARRFAQSPGESGAPGPRLQVAVIPDSLDLDDVELVETVDLLMDAAAEASEPAVVVFPTHLGAGGVLSLAAALATGDRWSLAPAPAWSLPGFGLRWRTPAGDLTWAMGLAPLESMPITRRTAHVGLALWPGRHENEHIKTRESGYVGLIDARTEMDHAKHQRHMTSSREMTERFLNACGEPHLKAMRELAFRLPEHARAAIDGLTSTS